MGFIENLRALSLQRPDYVGRGRIGRDGGNDVPGSRDDAAIYVVALCRP